MFSVLRITYWGTWLINMYFSSSWSSWILLKHHFQNHCSLRCSVMAESVLFSLSDFVRSLTNIYDSNRPSEVSSKWGNSLGTQSAALSLCVTKFVRALRNISNSVQMIGRVSRNSYWSLLKYWWILVFQWMCLSLFELIFWRPIWMKHSLI